MSVYLTKVAWPTKASGRPARSPEDLAPVHARIDDLDLARLELAANTLCGGSLAELGAHELDQTATPEHERADTEAGIDVVRARLHAALDDLADLGNDGVELEFDGVRWWAIGFQDDRAGFGPSDAADLLEVTGVTEAPLDADAFEDVVAVGATVAVLDTLAERVLAALRAAGTDAAALGAAEDALAQARTEVVPTARTLRRVLTQLTDQVRG